MSGIDGVGEAPAALAQGEPHRVKQSLTTGALLVELITPGGPLPFAYAKGSGTIVGAAGAVFGYAADDPSTLAVDHIGYLRNAGTTRVKLGVNVEAGANTFTVATTTVTLWRKSAGVWAATLATISFAFGVTGSQQATFAVAFADGDSWDIRVDNPGNVADVGKICSIGFGMDFF